MNPAMEAQLQQMFQTLFSMAFAGVLFLGMLRLVLETLRAMARKHPLITVGFIGATAIYFRFLR